MFTVNDVLEMKNKRKRVKKEVYQDIFTQCERRIKYASSKKHTSCIFVIPNLIYGYPPVNIYKAEAKLNKWLSDKGFKTESYYNAYEDNEITLSITWDNVNKLEIKNTQENTQQIGSISAVHTLNALKKRAKQLRESELGAMK